MDNEFSLYISSNSDQNGNNIDVGFNSQFNSNSSTEFDFCQADFNGIDFNSLLDPQTTVTCKSAINIFETDSNTYSVQELSNTFELTPNFTSIYNPMNW